MSPWTAETNEDQALDGSMSAGFCGVLLSRTGTVPETANAGAHSTQVPPFPSL